MNFNSRCRICARLASEFCERVRRIARVFRRSPTRTRGPGFGFFLPNRVSATGPVRPPPRPPCRLSLKVHRIKAGGSSVVIISRKHGKPNPKLVQHHEHEGIIFDRESALLSPGSARDRKSTCSRKRVFLCARLERKGLYRGVYLALLYRGCNFKFIY